MHGWKRNIGQRISSLIEGSRVSRSILLSPERLSQVVICPLSDSR